MPAPDQPTGARYTLFDLANVVSLVPPPMSEERLRSLLAEFERLQARTIESDQRTYNQFISSLEPATMPPATAPPPAVPPSIVLPEGRRNWARFDSRPWYDSVLSGTFPITYKEAHARFTSAHRPDGPGFVFLDEYTMVGELPYTFYDAATGFSLQLPPGTAKPRAYFGALFQGNGTPGRITRDNIDEFMERYVPVALIYSETGWTSVRPCSAYEREIDHVRPTEPLSDYILQHFNIYLRYGRESYIFDASNPNHAGSYLPGTSQIPAAGFLFHQDTGQLIPRGNVGNRAATYPWTRSNPPPFLRYPPLPTDYSARFGKDARPDIDHGFPSFPFPTVYTMVGVDVTTWSALGWVPNRLREYFEFCSIHGYTPPTSLQGQAPTGITLADPEPDFDPGDPPDNENPDDDDF